jgi:hypothetical protein
MSKGDALYELVHSLELNEKRYFKLHASFQKKNSNLAQLFDFLCSSAHYDDNEVRAAFEGEKFLDQLAVTKNHLYEVILKSMRSYHLKRSVDFRLQGMIQDVHFLYEKGLASQVETILRRLRKAALKHDSYLILLQVLEWETKLIAEGFFVGKDEADLDAISDEYYEVLGFLQNEREYIDLQFKVFNNYYKIGIERKNEGYKTNEQIVNQFALKDSSRALTFRSKCCFLNIHAQHNKINGNWEKAYAYRKELLDLVAERYHETFEPESLKRYFVAINNLVPICMKLGKLEELMAMLNELDGLEEKALATHYSVELGNRIRLQGMIGRLALYTRLGMVEEGMLLVERVKEMTDVIESYPRKYVVLHLYFNAAYFLFSIGKLSIAIQYINRIMNDNDVRSVEDLHASTRLLTMMVQYDMGRNEILEYLARSTKRYLTKLEGLYPFERILVAFMRRFSTGKALFNVPTAFKKLRKELVEVGYEPGERNALSTLDLLAWVDSKIEERPLHEILKERNGPRNTDQDIRP